MHGFGKMRKAVRKEENEQKGKGMEKKNWLVEETKGVN